MTTQVKPKTFRERTIHKVEFEPIEFSDIKIIVPMKWIDAELWCQKRVFMTSQFYAIRSIVYSHSVVYENIQYHWAVGTYLNSGKQMFLLVAIDFYGG